MRIAVLGAGQVGGTLGRRWAALGHTIHFGVRDPGRGAAAVKGGASPDEPLPPTASVVSVAQAVGSSDGQRVDAVVLTTPWGGVAETLRTLHDAHGPDALANTPLLDATNPLGPGFRLDVGPAGESGAERIQAMAPMARVVKVFNTTGYDNMRDPLYQGAATMMPYAGDDAEAKEVARELSLALGFDPIDAGPLARARELEHLALLWISLAYGGAGVSGLGRNFAFRLVKR